MFEVSDESLNEAVCDFFSKDELENAGDTLFGRLHVQMVPTVRRLEHFPLDIAIGNEAISRGPIDPIVLTEHESHRYGVQQVKVTLERLLGVGEGCDYFAQTLLTRLLLDHHLVDVCCQVIDLTFTREDRRVHSSFHSIFDAFHSESLTTHSIEVKWRECPLFHCVCHPGCATLRQTTLNCSHHCLRLQVIWSFVDAD